MVAGVEEPGRVTTLLVVDDEATVRELLSATLRFAGFRVTSATTGAEAVAAAAEEPPDLVLLRRGGAGRCPCCSSPRGTARRTR
ncbi:response regulator [Lentzea guizhouensis]|uniref:response regulator n=1 Tax=Lentzea guizhouensis TaxID=1586287 RepID=UPI002699952E